MYVHSAASGKLAGGRLTLHGVGRSVTWTTTGGSAGVARIRRAHERLFPPSSPATGTLHIGGQSGGEESVFRLSKPRYSAPRHTVSYRAKPLAKRRAAVMAAAAATRRFGAASLSVVPHSSLAAATTVATTAKRASGTHLPETRSSCNRHRSGTLTTGLLLPWPESKSTTSP